MTQGDGRLRSQIESAAQRIHDFTGREVVVTTSVKVGVDDRNNPIFEESEVETIGEIIRAGTPNFDSRVQGADADVDAAILIPDDVPVQTGEETDTGATTITDQYGDGTYTVVDVYREGHTGKQECHAELQ